MNKQLLEMIELEMAVFVRRVTSISSVKKIGKLDRSAYLLLHHLYTKGSSGVKALADEFSLDISTVSRQASSLEHKGYLEKVSDPLDGRAFFYTITDFGIQELVEYKQARIDRFSELLDDWTEEECESFGHLLKKLNKALIEK
ncbi:MarR family winged helix-turn-helix transcriptional regulator [Neobacillus sp. D3-1R]|uniref:MarR family winged helix-turn-helix transcriptional regulator n=1 Tax=Neobacillus sp. D3-1R TaxID=3445778 RepID=UPI003F9EF764